MPSQHKHDPVSFRPGTKPGDPDGDREWLLDRAEATGLAVGTIVSEAVVHYRRYLERQQARLRGLDTPKRTVRPSAEEIAAAIETLESFGDRDR
jgi:hypothetical protein